MGLPQKAREFKDAPRIVARGAITCGFELETQRTEGHRWHDLDEDSDQYDEERRAEDISERVDEICSGELWEFMSSRQQDAVRDTVYESVSEDWEWSPYRLDTDPAAYMRESYNIPSDVEIDEDGSVRGFEFRTKGPRTYPQFKRAAEALFRLDHVIDTKCSFHIHMAVKGVEHRYGRRMQAAMIEFLVASLDRVPESVRERWAGISVNQYIQGLAGSTNKYSFIHWHSTYKTWEFRCFGNVKNARDAMACLDLAIEAMQYAYQAREDKGSLLFDTLSDESWHAMVMKSLESGQPVRRRAKAA